MNELFGDFQKVEKNVDFLGNDIGFFENTTLKECKKECLNKKNPKCVGISTTFLKGEASTDSDHARCWLKSKFNRQNRNGINSWVR